MFNAGILVERKSQRKHSTHGEVVAQASSRGGVDITGSLLETHHVAHVTPRTIHLFKIKQKKKRRGSL